MSKEQIEEMSTEIREAVNGCSSYWSGLIAEHLFEQCYRKQEWISVDERLPKQWETVLVFCDDIVSVDFIASTGRWYEHIDHDSVTHWMPLPEPPMMKGGAE